MEQPPAMKSLSPNGDPSPPKDADDNKSSTKKKNPRRPPSPEEVLAYYESQGLDPKEASLKAISDLQSVLFRKASASSKDRSPPAADATARKLDTLNTRLAVVDMKLDSKPGFPESLAIGVASGAILHAAGAALPHLARIWDSVRSATRSSPP